MLLANNSLSQTSKHNMSTKVFLFLLFLVCGHKTYSARILGVVPIPSFSHQIAFRPIWRELSLRGHQVTVITTDPMNDANLTNLTEINAAATYEVFRKYNLFLQAADEGLLAIVNTFTNMLREMYDLQLSLPEVRNLINSNDTKFDLLIFEALSIVPLAFSWKFKCPIIGVASLDVPNHYHAALGNLVHPVITPDYNLQIEDPEDMTFMERLTSVFNTIALKYFYSTKFYPTEKDVLLKYFGRNVPVHDLKKNISMLFIGTNPIFHNVRALNPNTITIGNGIHITEPKPLPKDLKLFLDDAKEGAIYFSLGSNVNSKFLNDLTETEILKAFSKLPHKILMKYDKNISNKSDNVRIEKWVPQQDVLRHPNIKLFITQGGLQSLQEALSNGIPLIGIPFFGDQIYNVNKMVKKGYGIKVAKSNITTTTLENAIFEVLNNPKYAEQSKKMGQILLDEPLSSLEKAIWWIEYVIRHKGADHFKNVGADLPFYKYYLLDIILFIITVIAFIILLLKIILIAIKSLVLQKIFINQKLE